MQAPANSPVTEIVAALREKRFDDALRMSQTRLKSAPGDFRLWTLEGMADAGLGKEEAALAAYQHALKLSPRYLPALEGAAQTSYQLGEASAEPLLLRVLELRPDDATSHAMIGILKFHENDCAAALPHFEKATAALTTQPYALIEYGSCLGNAARFDEAARVFAQALAIDGTRTPARYNLALSQWKAKRDYEALASLQPLIEASPADADTLTLGAEIAEEKFDTQRAIELLRRAILEHPKSADAYIQFAYLSGNHASFQVGIDMLNAGLTQMPDEARLYLARGVLYGQLGDADKAMDDLEIANRLNPQLSFTGAAEGLLRSQQHRSAEALAKFREAAKAHPKDAFTQYLLAEALSGESKTQDSAEFREEVAAANRAVQLDTTLVAAHDLLAGLYLEDAQNRKAIEQSIRESEAALKIDPVDEQALYHLMLALRKTDRKGEVPALIHRLAELRRAAQSDQGQKKRYQIYEVPSGNGDPPAN